MGHQSNDAGKALRAYADDLQAAATRGGFASSIDTSKQGDAPSQFLGSGAPHQLAIAAAVVCVVLLGGIGFATATNSTPEAASELTNPQTSPSTSVVTVIARSGSVSSVNAIRAFNDLGLSRATDALDAAASAGVDSSPAVQQALGRLLDIVNARLEAAGTVDQSEVAVSLAIAELEAAVWPPGLDPDRLVPGFGGEPPGLNSEWLAQVRNGGIRNPINDSILTPPGHGEKDEEDRGRDTAPGQQKDKDKPENGGGKP
jgi:hypothetical protein